jgi:hypothetical protein
VAMVGLALLPRIDLSSLLAAEPLAGVEPSRVPAAGT